MSLDNKKHISFLPSSVKNSIRSKIRNLGIISFMGMGLLILASLVTYHSNDSSFNSLNSDNNIHYGNMLGFVGSYVSDILLQLFGYSSYLLCIFPLIWGFVMIKNSLLIKYNKFISLFGLLITLSVVLGTLPTITSLKSPVSYGGIAGSFFISWLDKTDSKILEILGKAFLFIVGSFLAYLLFKKSFKLDPDQKQKIINQSDLESHKSLMPIPFENLQATSTEFNGDPSFTSGTLSALDKLSSEKRKELEKTIDVDQVSALKTSEVNVEDVPSGLLRNTDAEKTIEKTKHIPTGEIFYDNPNVQVVIPTNDETSNEVSPIRNPKSTPLVNELINRLALRLKEMKRTHQIDDKKIVESHKIPGFKPAISDISTPKFSLVKEEVTTQDNQQDNDLNTDLNKEQDTTISGFEDPMAIGVSILDSDLDMIQPQAEVLSFDEPLTDDVSILDPNLDTQQPQAEVLSFDEPLTDDVSILDPNLDTQQPQAEVLSFDEPLADDVSMEEQALEVEIEDPLDSDVARFDSDLNFPQENNISSVDNDIGLPQDKITAELQNALSTHITTVDPNTDISPQTIMEELKNVLDMDQEQSIPPSNDMLALEDHSDDTHSNDPNSDDMNNIMASEQPQTLNTDPHIADGENDMPSPLVDQKNEEIERLKEELELLKLEKEKVELLRQKAIYENEIKQTQELTQAQQLAQDQSSELELEPVSQDYTQPQSLELEPVSQDDTQPQSLELEPVSQDYTQPQSLELEPVSQDYIQPQPSELEPVSQDYIQPQSLELEPVSQDYIQPKPSELESVSQDYTQPQSLELEPVSQDYTQPQSLELEPVSQDYIQPQPSELEPVSQDYIQPQPSELEPVSQDYIQPKPSELEQVSQDYIQPQSLELEPVSQDYIQPQSLELPPMRTQAELEEGEQETSQVNAQPKILDFSQLQQINAQHEEVVQTEAMNIKSLSDAQTQEIEKQIRELQASSMPVEEPEVMEITPVTKPVFETPKIPEELVNNIRNEANDNSLIVQPREDNQHILNPFENNIMANPLDVPNIHGLDDEYEKEQMQADSNSDYTTTTSDERPFILPKSDVLDLFDEDNIVVHNELDLAERAKHLEEALRHYKIKGEVMNVQPGPVVTLFEFEPYPGTKTSKVVNLAEDIARSLSAVSVRIAPIPGKSVIGIEMPNDEREMVNFRELVEDPAFANAKGALPFILGKDIGGAPKVADLASMPHLLVSGTTGSGKSVAINTIIMSLLYRFTPDELRLVLVDPKMLEFAIYEDIPHLLTPIVTESDKAINALQWAMNEMNNRYRLMADAKVRNIEGFNKKITKAIDQGETLYKNTITGFNRETGQNITEKQEMDLKKLPYIAIIIDELADLMITAGKEVEPPIQSLAQKARAAGIHLILATQRPSVNVITGTIKANFPSRMSFQLTSRIDSRTILDENGAEQLLGRGDMLYKGKDSKRPIRLHGPFVSDDEVEKTVEFLKSQGEPFYIQLEPPMPETSTPVEPVEDSEKDPLYDQAVEAILQDGKASTSFVQRKLKIGYNRAARIIEEMEGEGIVSPADRVGRRTILAVS